MVVDAIDFVLIADLENAIVFHFAKLELSSTLCVFPLRDVNLVNRDEQSSEVLQSHPVLVG